MHELIFLWVMVRLSVHIAEALRPSVRHQMVLDSLANRLQCVGRAKRLEWTTAVRGALHIAGGDRGMNRLRAVRRRA